MKELLGGILFIAVTILAGWLIIGKPIQTWHETRDWVETPAYILAADFVTHHDTHTNTLTYNTTARYRYTFSGVQYESTQVSIYNGSDNASSFYRQLYNILINYVGSNEPFRCFVNPDQPEQAILFRDIRWGLTFVIGLLALLFSLAGVALIVVSVRQMFGPPAQHAPNPEAQAYANQFIAQYKEAVEKGFVSDIQHEHPIDKKTLATKLLPLFFLPAIRQRKIAALLALILGWTGVHKFYLGKPIQGFLYLFFVWTMLPLMLSMVDCIRLLLMSDAAFDKRYRT